MLSTLQNRIADLIARAGPPTKRELVFSGEKTIKSNGVEKPNPEYVEYGEFTFRRLNYKELDGLRLNSLNNKGEFDRGLFAGNNARFVAATLVDDDTLQPVYDFDSVNEWPGGMVDAFAAAGNRVNVTTVAAAKEVEKNSDATPAASS